MQLNKLVPMVGFCAVSFLPVSATADHHLTTQRIINAQSGMCLDATSEGGFVQQSKCQDGLKGQLWTLDGHRIVNVNWPNQCLDIYVIDGHPLLNTVQTSTCEGWKQAQEWEIDQSKIQNGYTDQCLVAPGNRALGPVQALRCQCYGGFEAWQVVEVGGPSAPVQADEAPVQSNTEPSGAKYGAMAFYCKAGEDNAPPSPCEFSYSNNHTSQEEANQHALEKCGVSGCEVVIKLTNACGVLVGISDTWEHNGKTVGYKFWNATEQDDAVKFPLLADLEKYALEQCNANILPEIRKIPGYTFKPCQVIDSSCPTTVQSVSPKQ